VWTNNTSNNGTIFEAMSEPGGDMCKFWGTGNDNFKLGTALPGARGTYYDLWAGTLSTGVERTLTLHYKADNGLLDFYIDDDLIVQDFETPGYAMHRFQALSGGASVAGDTINEITIGVPEPATMALLGLGAVALLRRRR